MNTKQFIEIKKSLDAYAKAIVDKKRPEYIGKSKDVLANFKRIAEQLGLTPLEVWAVYFSKQTQAIFSHAHNPKMTQAEPIQSRFADALNYLYLGYALIIENETKKNAKH